MPPSMKTNAPAAARSRGRFGFGSCFAQYDRILFYTVVSLKSGQGVFESRASQYGPRVEGRASPFRRR
jgi:hypothetical protein